MIQITKAEAKKFQAALTHQRRVWQSEQRDEYQKNGISEYYNFLTRMQKDNEDLIQDLYKRINNQ